MSRLRVTILGCGSSGGVPRADGDWGQCDPAEPRNRRSRCGLLVQRWRDDVDDPRAATTALIDTSPDLREQLIAAHVSHVDAILYTHDHADQTHGIDDVRALVLRMRRRARVWMDAPTRERLMRRFGYCFAGEGGYPPILEDCGDLRHGENVVIDGPGGDIAFTPLTQDHGGTISLGFRFGAIAYSNDVVALPQRTLSRLDGLDLWIVDALRRNPHPTHAHLARSLEWIAAVRPRRAVLTNMHVDLDYQTLRRELPPGVEPAHDGWSADFII
jgi:phosphoribosyl 1,2-cyclic phosphate phosphodiesterase